MMQRYKKFSERHTHLQSFNKRAVLRYKKNANKFGKEGRLTLLRPQ